ncbi:MAG: MbtH domain protein [Bacteroidota bacterium]
MNDLVERLSSQSYDIEAARPEKTVKTFQECVDRDYVHIMFKQTQTELGIKLDRKKCDFSSCNLNEGMGKVHLEGGVTLNFETVRVVADLDLRTLEGQGKLKLISQEEYASFMSN